MYSRTNLYITVMIVFTLLMAHSLHAGTLNDEYRLHEFLTSGYNTAVRPVKLSSDAVNLVFDVAIQQIIEVNEKEESVVLSVFFRQYWTDAKLVWNPADYGNIKNTKVKSNSIWLPDMTLYNNAEKDDNFGGNLDQLTNRISVSSDGSVSFLSPAIVTGKCPMNIRYFPFDVQHCQFKFGSWTYHGDEIDIKARNNKTDLGSYSEHSEWSIDDASMKRNVLYYGCCPEPYPDVTVELVLKRKPLFYILNLLLPMIFIGILTLLSFFLPADSGERISFAVTLMLALTVFMLIVAEMIPASSETVPMLVVFFTCVMVQMVLMVFAMAYTLNLHLKQPSECNRIGKWTRKIIYDGLAVFFGIRNRDLYSVSAGIKMMNGHLVGAHDNSIQASTNGSFRKIEMNGCVRRKTETTLLEGESSPRCIQCNHKKPEYDENSVTNKLLKKSIKLAEEKVKDEEFEKTVKNEFVVCAKTYDVLALIVFAVMFVMILLVYLLNTNV